MADGERGDTSGRLDTTTRAATERWFLARGLPHLGLDYTAREDIFTRAASFLSLVFLVEMLGALNLDWPWWANAAAIVGAIVVLLGAWATVNHLRGRPRFALPDDVGPVELAAFLLVPAAVPAIFGGQVGSAAATLAVNAGVLGVVYVATSYALVPMIRWSAEQMVRNLSQVAGLFARTLPLFLIFATFVFINAEMWQVAADFDALTFTATAGLLILVVVAFLLAQLPRQVAELAALEPASIPALCTSTPLEGLARPAAVEPLGRRARGNAMLVLLVAQAIQVVIVSAAIGMFFVGFGLVAITPDVTAAWTGEMPDPLLEISLGDRSLVVTDTLLYVAGFLAAFASLYFTVQSVTDADYRDEVLGAVTAEVREAVAVRAVYRDLLGPPNRPEPNRPEPNRPESSVP